MIIDLCNVNVYLICICVKSHKNYNNRINTIIFHFILINLIKSYAIYILFRCLKLLKIEKLKH